jgi:putative transposase
VRSLDAAIAAKLVETLPPLARLEQAALLEMAVMPDHVHVLVELSPASVVSRLVQRFKGATARFANRDGWSTRLLCWEKGYDSRSIGRQAIPAVKSYLDTQAQKHHMPLMARWSGPGRADRAAGARAS